MSLDMFLILWLGACFLLMVCATGSMWLDRVLVVVMRALNVRLYPTAIDIAILLTEHPDQWSADKYEMRHPDLSAIWTANGAHGLHVETAFGTWKPNWIERRVIRDAVDWRLHGYVRNRIAVAMQKRALQ